MKIIKTRIKTFIKDKKYFFLFFLFLIIYNFVVTGSFSFKEVDDITYTYHTVDYSMGFCTKFLPGALYGLLIKNYSQTAISIYAWVLLCIFFALIAFMLQEFVLSFDRNQRKSAIVTSMLFLTGPCTFSIFVTELGMLDFYWVLISAIILLLIKSKKAAFLAVPMFFGLILVHFSSILSYIPFCLLIILYEAASSNKKSEKVYYSCIFTFSLLLSLAATLYFAKNERSNLTYSMEEFNKILSNRGSDYFFYYDYVLYRSTEGTSAATAIAENANASFAGVVLQQLKVNFQLIEITLYEISAAIIILPIVILSAVYFIYNAKKTPKNKFRHFITLCMFLMFFVTIGGGCLFSTDVLRWMSHAYIALFASFIYVLYKENGSSFLSIVYSKIPYSYAIFFIVLSSVSIFTIYN